MNLKSKCALVTGGSMGIGAAIAVALAENGADVAFTYRRHEEEAKKIASRIQELGRKGVPIKSDASSFQDAERTVREACEKLGGLHILVNNAGINRDRVVWKMSEEDRDNVSAVDLTGYFSYNRHVAPIFKEQNYGKIINITSINGLRGKFGQSNYSAAKAGVIGLTKAVAKELGKYNVNVNAVAPGLIETEMMKQAPEQVREMALSEIVLGRLGAPEDVANVVVFLASDLARHITGEVIKVDGGQYI